MKPGLLLLCLLCSLFAIAQQKNNFSIIGNLPEDVEVDLFLFVESDTLKTRSVQGRFLFEGYVSRPTLVTLKSTLNCGSRFYIDSTQMALSTTIRKDPNGVCIFKDQLEGSVYQRIFENYRNRHKEITSLQDTSLRRGTLKELVSSTIIANPNFSFSGEILSENFQNFGTIWGKEMLGYLSEEVQRSALGKKIVADIKNMEATAIGGKIDFIYQKTPDGDPFHLSSLSGKKIILLDFWASWCVPCRKKHPSLVNLFNKYQRKGLEIVSISLDEDQSKWMSAIKADNLNWTNISDLKGWNNELVKRFSITAIPFNILIDDQGSILANNLNHEKLSQLLDKFPDIQK